jgi:hypothetical protein
VIPRWRAADSPNTSRWYVGVDFGTSNTLLAIRENDQPTATVFHDEAILLQLTRSSADTERFLESFFFPGAIAAVPFGTAIYHLRSLPTLNVDQEPLALRTTVPFDGRVENDSENRIVGNLKWTVERETLFLTAAFLRHLTATVLTSALRRGVQPENVQFFYSYPRAFQGEQVRNLGDLWQKVVSGFEARGLKGIRVERGPDESRCVLRHFFSANLVSTAGDVDVVVDVGGGTTDIAAYGNGRTLILDSLHLGGRNLTGGREQAETEAGLRNPFVDAFVRWAAANDFPEAQRPVLEKYLRDGQVHLAFTYLMRTPWYQNGEAGLFRSTRAGEAFQQIVFYFFAAIFHHLGLSFRALHDAGQTAAPFSVTFAGNGSQYLKWLGDSRSSTVDAEVRAALIQVFETASGLEAGALAVRMTGRPKEEVASGLVARGAWENETRADAVLARSLVGEAVTAVLGPGAAPRTLAPTDALEVDERFGLESATLRWNAEEMELQRFHRSVVRAARRMSGHGGHWTEAPAKLDRFFGELKTGVLQNGVARKLEYLARVHGGFSGSLFILGAAGVLDQMMDKFVGGE